MKGLLYALKAVRELWTERRNIEFRIIGDETLTGGGDAAQILTYIRRNALQKCVRLLGHLSHQCFLQEMEKGDLFIQPSITTANGATEGGAPTTILEAQALGMPILSTYHCDIPNVTVPGQSALLVPEKDSKALAQALRTLVDAPGKWEEMGVAGRRHVEKFHDIEKEAPRLEEKYLQLMSGRNQT